LGINYTAFLQAGCLSGYPLNSVEALKEIQSTDSSQEASLTVLILPSSTTSIQHHLNSAKQYFNTCI